MYIWEKSKKSCVIFLSVMVLCIVNAGRTVAWLAARSNALENSFEPVKSECEIEETFEENVKSNVSIRNTGTVSSYLRGIIVVTWKDKEGNNCGKSPLKDKDYTLILSKDGWTEHGGFYYWNKPVKPNDSTGVLIKECKPLSEAPSEEYTLHVEILAEAVQAEPIKAVQDAWGFVPSNSQGG